MFGIVLIVALKEKLLNFFSTHHYLYIRNKMTSLIPKVEKPVDQPHTLSRQDCIASKISLTPHHQFAELICFAIFVLCPFRVSYCSLVRCNAALVISSIFTGFSMSSFFIFF